MFSFTAKRGLFVPKRYKVTLTKANPSPQAQIKRPTPILFVRTLLDSPTKLSDLGYASVDAAIHIKPEQQDPLSTYYRELSQVTNDLSFFPPLMISRGPIAWRISQKYVSNKPVSGLVMVDSDQDESCLLPAYPTSPFEPHFPICMVSRQSPPDFLEGWIDHYACEDEITQVLVWMDEMGM
ncbi:uncharacterized protein B0P05DRAFT_278445 [Gilbertella persicaria]|uniref:uncharacterized protein n=1 Tax=Gilbertella persicaria TaxID=101096 RepID=UPI0022200318|nr:uncharacterized protein B0P05DRAFT_278445 [Gilbertella persicaria]KAI8058650.1 hypothetical protein B0P05DRAFT_278445 [Gilbertella persicaria]